MNGEPWSRHFLFNFRVIRRARKFLCLPSKTKPYYTLVACSPYCEMFPEMGTLTNLAMRAVEPVHYLSRALPVALVRNLRL